MTFDKELDARGIRGESIAASPKTETFEELTKLIDAKKVKPVVTQTFALKDVAKAQEQIATRHTRGKLVLQVSSEPKL